jgi:CheY-like chemotaxis protein
MKVLIAEDDYASRLILQRTLEGFGHECLATEDGLQAWGVYRKTPDIDVVVSDWMMPNMDGIEFCRRVRGLARERRTFFIMLTALGSKERLLEGLRAGADEYLVKPLDREQLRARLDVASQAAALHRHLDRENGPEADESPAAEVTGDRQEPEAENARVWGILVSQGKLNEEQLLQALEVQKSDPREIGEILVSLGTISKVDLARVRAQRLGLSYLEIDVRDIDPRAVDLLPEPAMREHGVISLRSEGGRLFVATSAPADVDTLAHLGSISGHTVVPVAASAEDIQQAQARLFVSEQSNRVLEQASDAASGGQRGQQAQAP